MSQIMSILNYTKQSYVSKHFQNRHKTSRNVNCHVLSNKNNSEYISYNMNDSFGA
jgi:hypothetical protein